MICGFETFKKYIIRVDILERLFLKIISSSKDNIFELTNEMLNLLGCTKEDFKELMKEMNYKLIEENKKILFKYITKKNFSKKINIKNSNSPFYQLKKIKIIS